MQGRPVDSPGELPARLHPTRMRAVDRVLERLEGRGRILLIGGLGAAGLAFLLGLAGRPGSPSGFSFAALVVVRLIAALLSLSTARSLRPSPPSRAWRFLGTGWILAGLSAVLLWASWVLSHQPRTAPSAADLLLLAAYCSALWAVASAAFGSQERFGRLRGWLDVAILVLATLGLAWLVFVQPILEIGLADDVATFWAVLWPTLDLCFLGLVLRLVLAAGPHPLRPLAILGGAGTSALVANLGTGYLALLGEAATPAFLAAFSLASPLLGGWAALEARRASEITAPQSTASRARGETLLPVAFTYAVVGFTAVDAWLEGSVDLLALVLSIGLTILLFARQGVVAGQAEMRQHAALIEGAADMAFIARPDGVVTFANPSFDRAMGRPAEPRAAIHLRDLLAPGEDVDQILTRAVVAGWQGDVDFSRADGSTFPARLSLRPVAVERQRPVLAATAVDLTQIVERERLLRSALDDVAGARSELEALNRALEAKVEERTRELQQMVADLDRLNQELRALDRVKSEFVALVSHELRAPLTNIRTGIELLVDDEGQVSPPARESLDLILEETDRLGKFVEAILDLSALEAGRFPLRPESIDLASTAAAAAARFRPADGIRRIGVELPADLPDAWADPRAVTSVFHHLLDNAMKYGGEGEIDVTGEAEPDRITIAVTDHGPGIPEAQLERVFDRFHRLDSSDSRATYGHGLGLHLARRLLEAMGGGIRAERVPEGGARMVFWLPRQAQGPGL